MSTASLRRRLASLEHGSAFRSLHRSTFVMPNPWDVGSARALEAAGFPALGTTMTGTAFLHGRPEHELSPEEMREHSRWITRAVAVPVNADLVVGEPSDVADTVKHARSLLESGVAGVSVWDTADDRTGRLLAVDTQVRRLDAVQRAIRSSGRDVVLTACTGSFLSGDGGAADEALHRLVAYAECGADVVSAPGLLNIFRLKQLLTAVRPLPVEVVVPFNWHVTVSDLADLGVGRISLGSSLARVAWGGVWRAVTELCERGSFRGLGGQVPLPFTEMTSPRPAGSGCEEQRLGRQDPDTGSSRA